MANEFKQYIAVRAIIIHRNKILAIRESQQYQGGVNKGKYDLPGGKVKPGELIHAALRREVNEECGLTVKIGDVFFVGEWRPKVKDVQLQIFGIYFICTPKRLKVTLGADHDDYVWLDRKSSQECALSTPNDKVLELLISKGQLK